MKEPSDIVTGKYFVIHTGEIVFVSRVDITKPGIDVTYRVEKGKNQGKVSTLSRAAFAAQIERGASPAEVKNSN